MIRANPISGIAMAMALAACAARPVMQPSPLFESNTRTDQRAPIEPGRPASLAESPRDSARAAPSAPHDVAASPVPPLPGGSAQTKTVYATICDGLRRDAHAKVEPIDGGARLVLRPSSAAAVIRVRRAARDLERTVATDTGASTEPPCALFELAERGASFRVHEEGDTVQIDITAKPEDRAAVRAAVRRYIEADRHTTP